MDLATISMKELRKKGYLDDMEVSEEINACSIEITVHTNQGDEQWLLMFKMKHITILQKSNHLGELQHV